MMTLETLEAECAALESRRDAAKATQVALAGRLAGAEAELVTLSRKIADSDPDDPALGVLAAQRATAEARIEAFKPRVAAAATASGEAVQAAVAAAAEVAMEQGRLDAEHVRELAQRLDARALALESELGASIEVLRSAAKDAPPQPWLVGGSALALAARRVEFNTATSARTCPICGRQPDITDRGAGHDFRCIFCDYHSP